MCSVCPDYAVCQAVALKEQELRVTAVLYGSPYPQNAEHNSVFDRYYKSLSLSLTTHAFDTLMT
jgi:hypothetical protein